MAVIVTQPPIMLDKAPDAPTLFLAGPIQGASDWQQHAIDHVSASPLASESDIIIANPRRQYLDGEFVYANQVNWEGANLHRAASWGVILFWLPCEAEHDCGRSYAQTTRFELAEWVTRRFYDPRIDIVIGAEEGFSGAKYIRHKLNPTANIGGAVLPEIIVHDSLAATLDQALTRLPISIPAAKRPLEPLPGDPLA